MKDLGCVPARLWGGLAEPEPEVLLRHRIKTSMSLSFRAMGDSGKVLKSLILV